MRRIAILIYIWFRFEWQFAIGAIIALVHDAVTTLGLFSLLGLEFNLSSVAAVLTIIGYSTNDTVVIYDRVRENLRRYKTMPLPELIDRSINQTLARTVMTTLTTLLGSDRSGRVRWPGHPRLHHRHALGRPDRHLLHGLRGRADDSPFPSPARGHGAGRGSRRRVIRPLAT